MVPVGYEGRDRTCRQFVVWRDTGTEGWCFMQNRQYWETCSWAEGL